MPFSSFGLHADLLRGVKELGFKRPTPIQTDAMPPAIAGKDVLACAMTGSGKSAAFLLPILNRLIGKKRGTTRALILTPTRELAAQIDEHLRELAVHTPLSGAAVYGGVGMGPQEHAFRSGVDVIVATPGRLLDHFQYGYAKLEGLEILVLDEADRMLDMGFLPDIRRVLRHLPTKLQTLFFSATLPQPIVELSREMLKNPATIAIERKSAPATGITQSVFPVSQDLKLPLLETLLKRREIQNAIVFTRPQHRANRVFEQLERHKEREARRETGDHDPGTDRRDPRAQSRRSRPREGEGGATSVGRDSAEARGAASAAAKSRRPGPAEPRPRSASAAPAAVRPIARTMEA